jgi:hypothetical protein
LVESVAAIAGPGERVAQRAGHPVQHGRVEQELAQVVGLVPEDLLDEVVEDEPVAAGESVDELGGTVVSAHRQPSQLKARCLAFSARVQRRDLLGARRGARVRSPASSRRCMIWALVSASPAAAPRNCSPSPARSGSPRTSTSRACSNS